MTAQNVYDGVKIFDQMHLTLEELKNTQEKILIEIEKLKNLQGSNKDNLDYLTEKEAGIFLKKKSTWFFNMKKSGLLPYSKVGGKVFYSKKDLLQLIEKGKTKYLFK